MNANSNKEKNMPNIDNQELQQTNKSLESINNSSKSLPSGYIKTKNLKKRYGRSNFAVNGIDLNVPKGSVYAFLGRNGAGKSTTIKMLLGLLEPTSGDMKVCGVNPLKKPLIIKEKIGYVAENQKMYD